VHEALIAALALGEAALITAAAVFLRIAAAVAVLPAFGEQSLSMRIRLAAAVALTVLVAPAVGPGIDAEGWQDVYRLMASETAIGLVFGILLRLMILALQLVAGRSSVWLPHALKERSVERASFARIVHYSLPWVERIERLARPRLWPGATRIVDRLIGVSCLVMALLLFLPIPFANAAPALSIIALGLALSERDGVWLILGLLGSVFAVVFVAAIIGGGAFALARIF